MEKTMYVTATTTAPSREVAELLAQNLVQKRLAACVQIAESITSYYWWEGAVQKDTELLILIKTTQSRIPEINQLLSQIHPYEVPELLTLPVQSGRPEYLKWIGENVQAQITEGSP